MKYLVDSFAGNLLPHTNEAQQRQLDRSLTNIRRVAMPSILELLQRGFERLERQRGSIALTDGLPAAVLAERHVALAFQHRMHPEISTIPPRTVLHARRP